MSRSRKNRYRGSRAVSGSCRSHGGCPQCLGNHKHKHARQPQQVLGHYDTTSTAEESAEFVMGSLDPVEPTGAVTTPTPAEDDCLKELAFGIFLHPDE